MLFLLKHDLVLIVERIQKESLVLNQGFCSYLSVCLVAGAISKGA